MIQVYTPENTAFETNGDMTLFPQSARIVAAINGSWEASLEHITDSEGRWKYLKEDAVVKMPSFNGDQMFRIRNVKKTASLVTCEMEPIFYDAIDDCFLADVRPTDKNGQEALNIMLASNPKYRANSDIKTVSTAYYQDVNFMEALNGNLEQSFVKRWGGEICFDNFEVMVNKRLGNDNGVTLLYGKNIKKAGLTEEINTSEVVTRIKPKAYNGYTMSGTGFVDSPLINTYPTIRIRTMKFDDVKMQEDVTDEDADNGIIICKNQEELNTALRKKCQEQYELGLDKPKITINADLVLLENTDLYRDFENLEKVSLGDTIHCSHSALGIITDARIISLEYDSVKKKVSGVTIGDYQSDYFDSLIDLRGEIANLTEEIENPDSDFQKGMQKLIDDMAALITGNTGGNMIIANNSSGKPNGFMIMDTESKDTAKKVLYFNLSGITYSNNGVNGPFNAVWSFEKGGFVADWIVAGTLSANRINGGIMKLGGKNNGNGILRICDADGSVIGTWDCNGINANNGNIGGFKFRGNNFEGYKPDGNIGFSFGYDSQGGAYSFYCDGKIESETEIQTEDMTIWGDLKVYGTKNRVVRIEGKTPVCMNAYETAEAYFGDIGFAKVNETGECIVQIDPVFSQTVCLDEYAVFIQPEGPGELYVAEKAASYFRIIGSPDLNFAYEIKAKQKDYESVRMESVK